MQKTKTIVKNMSLTEHTHAYHTSRVLKGHYSAINASIVQNIHEKGALLYPAKIDVALGTATDIVDFGNRSQYAGITRIREIELSEIITEYRSQAQQQITLLDRVGETSLWNALAGDSEEKVEPGLLLDHRKRPKLISLIARHNVQFREARDELVKSHLPVARAAVAPHVYSGLSIDELEASAYDRLITSAERFDWKKGYFARFAYSSVKRGLLDEYKLYIQEVTLQNPLARHFIQGDDEDREEVLSLRRAVSALPESDKSVIFLSYWGGLTPEQIAKRLKMNVKNVRELLSGAISRVRSYLESGIPSDETGANQKPLLMDPSVVFDRERQADIATIETEAMNAVNQGIRLTGPDLKAQGYSTLVDKIRRKYPGGIRQLRIKYGLEDTVARRRNWRQDPDPLATVIEGLKAYQRQHGPFTVYRARQLGYAWLEKKVRKYFPEGIQGAYTEYGEAAHNDTDEVK